MSLINSGGCFQRHTRPSCLFKQHLKTKTEPVSKDAIESAMASGALSEEESARIFGEDWTNGNVPERGTEAYLTYIEEVLKTQMDVRNKKLLDRQTQDVENRLRRLSMSPLPASHSSIGVTGSHDPSTDPDSTAELHGVSTLSDKLSKLRPEYFCDPVKTYDKMTFRELI